MCENAPALPWKPSPMPLIGYARASTEDQNLEPQLDALRTAGCGEVFEEFASGANRSRPQLVAALARVQRGDTLMVVRLDRLDRSLSSGRSQRNRPPRDAAGMVADRLSRRRASTPDTREPGMSIPSSIAATPRAFGRHRPRERAPQVSGRCVVERGQPSNPGRQQLAG